MLDRLNFEKLFYAMAAFVRMINVLSWYDEKRRNFINNYLSHNRTSIDVFFPHLSI